MEKSIKEKVSHYVYEQTSQFLYAQNYEKLGISAHVISTCFFIDRSNASRILNQLFQEGGMCKKIGRPTLYISLDALHKILPKHNCPRIISTKQKIEDFLFADNSKRNNTNDFSSLFQGIGYSINESMHELSLELQKILMYPQKKKILFINGIPNNEKKNLIQMIFTYYKKIGFITNTIHINEIDLEYTTDTIFKRNCSEIFMKLKGKKLLYLHLRNHENVIDYFYEILHHEIQQYNDECIVIVDTNFKEIERLNLLYPVIAMPTYFDFTAKEKVEYVFSMILNEATNINKTISFSKNLACCLVMCSIIESLDQLRLLIHKTCLNAYYRLDDKQELKLMLEDLPEDMLEHIEGTPQYMEKINHVFHVFSTTTFYVFPMMESIELNALLHSRINERQKIISRTDVDIISICKQEIQNFKQIFIDDISSSDKAYYEILALLTKKQLCDEYHATILTYHVFHAIKNIKKGTYQEKSVLNNKSEYIILSSKVTDFILSLEKVFSICMPIYEKMFINSFLMYTNQASYKAKIGVIFCMSTPKLSEVYSATVNQTFNDEFTTYSKLSFSKFHDDYVMNYKLFLDELKLINYHKGIVILTDTYLPFNLLHRLKSEIQTDIKVTTNLSNVQIKKIHELSDLDSIDFDDIFRSDNHPSNSNEFKYDEHNNLFEVLNQTLQKQLSFLDAYKIVPLLTSTFHNIIDELHIEFSNNLLIAFLMHASFVIERSIKDDPLPYKGINKLQRENRAVYNVIYKNMKELENHFHSKIQESELAYIVEIFADAIRMNSNEDKIEKDSFA